MKVLNTNPYRNIILGRDFLAHFNTVEFDFVKKRVKLGSNWHDCVNMNQNNVVNVIRKDALNARSESIINVKCSNSLSLITADHEPLPLQGASRSICNSLQNNSKHRRCFSNFIIKYQYKPVSINANKQVGTIIAIEDSVSSVNKSELINSINLEDSIVYGKNLSSVEKEKISSLISSFGDIFAKNPMKPTLVKDMQHHIITDETQPVNRKPYRIPHAWHKETENQMNEMLRNKIIRPSSSPWNAPIILAKKKDGSMHFVCDFRSLNDVIKKDSNPLPNIRDVINKMHGAQFWTTVDAASAYWSMPLVEEGKERTAFSIPRGKCEFNVTPFGLYNTGASYQRLMDILLSGFASDRIMAYMDDIVIFSKSFEDHLVDIENFFLNDCDLQVYLSSCPNVFLQTIQSIFSDFNYLEMELFMSITMSHTLKQTKYIHY